MTELKPQPEHTDFSDEEWENMAPSMRYYYRNKESEKERIRERKAEIREWLADYKKKRGCSRCDEDHPACLDFHHQEKKEAGIAEMANDGYSKQRIREEMEKCILLCANCHRKEHSELA